MSKRLGTVITMAPLSGTALESSGKVWMSRRMSVYEPPYGYSRVLQVI